MKNKINIIGLCLILFVAMPVLFKQNTFAAKASKIDSKFTEPVTFSKKEYSLIKTKELKELTVYLFFQPKEDALKWSSYITKNQWKKNRRIFSDIVMPYYQSSKSSWLIKAWMEEVEDSKFNEEYLMRFINVGPDGKSAMYSLHRIVKNKRVVRSVIYSVYIPYDAKKDSDKTFLARIKKNATNHEDKWIEEIKQFELF